ncbi:MAG: hypothetical protein IJS58_07420 [Bacilli bacterium]|nr:hypothetical protein [Bacilli bacterium]
MDVKPVYLICVDGNFGTQGHNKAYNMTPLGNGNFKAEWGRVGGNMSSKEYPMSKWDSTIRSKLAKGYVDRSADMQDVIEDSKIEPTNNGDKDEFSVIQNISVRTIIKRLFDYANKVVQASYRVQASVVTQAMIDHAQDKIDLLAQNYTRMSINDFNNNLQELFVIIPRKMRSVKQYLANDKTDFLKIIDREQDTLDSMRGMVYKRVDKSISTATNTSDNNTVSILDKMGITMEDATDEDVAKIKKAMGDAAGKFYKAWKVSNKATEAAYQKFTKENNIGNVKLTCHGSKNCNWLSILKSGLMIRPTGVATTGQMFGLGIYYSNPDKYHGGVAKSIGYTSLNGSYWARGGDTSGFLAFFETALGESYDAYSFDSKYYNFNLQRLKQEKPNAWNLFAHGNTNMLRNDEIIIYDNRQTTIRYLVEIR